MIEQKTLAERAAMARNAVGTDGRCADYVKGVAGKLAELGIDDPEVQQIWDHVRLFMRCVYACDIGSTRSEPSNFGWARVDLANPNQTFGSRNIALLSDYLARDTSDGRNVAIGFEAPAFLPVPDDPLLLSRGRDREGNRAWCYGAGAYVTTLGIHQAAWILRAAFEAAGRTHQFTTDWTQWLSAEGHLFCVWEAFVSGSAHSATNDPVQDAATAAHYFITNEKKLGTINAVWVNPRISLIGAAALWAGWSKDVALLHEPVLVVRPEKPFFGSITSDRQT